LTDRNWFLLAFACHTTAMVKRGFEFTRCPVNNLYEATVFICWTIVTACLLIGLRPRFRSLGALASPVLFGIGVFALMPALDVRGPVPNGAHRRKELKVVNNRN
jgi:ABC-type transport system involved in cytochrome c biogenesis permease subunit